MTNIALFGTIFVDVKGFSANPYDPAGRNVGQVRFIHGGVGRNVAENLGVLAMPVTFVSIVDDNAMGREVIGRLQDNGIDTGYVRTVPEGGTGMWLAILDEKGDLAGSVSKVQDFRLFEALLDEQGTEIITRASHVVLEIDLNETIARKVVALAKELGRPVYGIPGNLEVTLRRRELLADLECFVCNDIEAEKIFEVSFAGGDVALIKAELEKFVHRMGMRSMIVTLGAKGAVYYRRGMGEAKYQAVKPVRMLDSTGAGDAFFSGVTMGLVKGWGMDDAVRCGAKVAAYTIQSQESTCVGFQPGNGAEV